MMAKQQPGGWTTSTVFALFLLLTLIATINVFIVTFAWEKFAKFEEQSDDRLTVWQYPSSASMITTRDVKFTPRKVNPEDWTKTSIKCRFEDCTALAGEWSVPDLRICVSGLYLPTGMNTRNETPMIILVNSSCVTPFEDEQEESTCRRSFSSVVVVVEGTIPFLEDVKRILAHDESFPVGLGVKLELKSKTTDEDWDIYIGATDAPHVGRLHVEENKVYETRNGEKHCVKRRTSISVNANAKARPNVLYGTIRHAIGKAIQRLRSPARIKLAAMLIWAGAKPPPVHLLEVAQAFVRSDNRITIFIMIEDQFAEAFKIQYDNKKINKDFQNRIRLIHHYDETSKGNLTHFIHTRSDTLVPSIQGHYQYALGWSLCDFRWLFGAIFESFLPETEFTHWAWADSDAFPGRMFGPISDYGFDLERHDVTSFAAIILERDSPPSSMMAYSSGTFTAIKNNEKGRNLFRYTPKEKLDRALTRSSNGILDEVGTSNGVFAAPNVSIALIASQARLAGTIYDESSGKLYFVATKPKDFAELDKLRTIGRVMDPFATAPLGFATVLARFAGGDPLPGQVRYVHPDDNNNIRWYQSPQVNPDRFLNLYAAGTGFSTLLRDVQGHWWSRPLPHDTLYRSRNRKLGAFAESRPFVRVEIAIVHSRLGGPCVINGEVADFDLTIANQIDQPKSLDLSNKKCTPFKMFFSKHP